MNIFTNFPAARINQFLFCESLLEELRGGGEQLALPDLRDGDVERLGGVVQRRRHQDDAARPRHADQAEPPSGTSLCVCRDKIQRTVEDCFTTSGLPVL